MTRSRLLWSLCMLTVALTATVRSVGLVVLDGFEIRHIATNLNPTAMRTAPDGRIFLCEKHGALRVISNDILLEEPVLTITTLSTWNERGLIGVAFDPDFETNSWLYVQYTWTDGTQVKARVSRFTLDGDALEGSETVIFESDPYSTDAGMHNGGSLVIDNDGKMFVFVGDIFDRNLAPDLNKTFGKVFRINLDGTIPEDNPYYDTLEGINRAIWARGLRNPFMVAYDPDSDTTIIGDVGEATWEELNVNQKGANYGWPYTEGFSPSASNSSDPELAYHHNAGCAITGLAFYSELEDEAEYLFPEEYEGKLFFGDYCKGWIRYIDIYDDIAVRKLNSSNIDALAPVVVTGTVGGLSMTQGLDGGLYFTERGTYNGAFTTNMGVLTGSVYKLIYTGSRAPVIYQQLEQWPPLPTGKTYTLFIGATGAAPLTYKWFKNDTIVSGAANNTLSIWLTAAMNGTRYRVEVSNPNGTVTSDEVVMLVSGDTGFGVTIWTSQSTYSAGDVIEFNATVTDPTNDPLRLVSWVIELSHQKHTHPFTSFSNVDGGSVTIPLVGELDPVQGYIFSVFVYNSVVSINAKTTIRPNLGLVTLETNPPGLGLLIDEADTYPIYSLNISGVANMERIFYAPGAQSIGNDTYVFVGWSDGDTSNEKAVLFGVNSVQSLIANYCSIINCPDLPLAPTTERPLILPPVNNQTATFEPAQEPALQPADEGRQLVSSYSPFIENGLHKLVVLLINGIVLFV